jgi:hypothetical protein
MQATRRTAMCSTNGSLPERPDRRQRSGCGPPRSGAVLTVTGVKQSLVEAKLRWVMVGSLGNNGRRVGPCRIIGIHEIGFRTWGCSDRARCGRKKEPTEPEEALADEVDGGEATQSREALRGHSGCRARAAIAACRARRTGSGALQAGVSPALARTDRRQPVAPRLGLTRGSPGCLLSGYADWRYRPNACIHDNELDAAKPSDEQGAFEPRIEGCTRRAAGADTVCADE